MTKEECLKALQGYKDLFELHTIDYYVPEKRRKKFLNNFKCFENLIDEHFDNPPLNLDEINSYMWVWDNQSKKWIEILKKGIVGETEELSFYEEVYKIGLKIVITTELKALVYDDNRFYRKQVQ